jgi:hypothetical protein
MHTGTLASKCTDKKDKNETEENEKENCNLECRKKGNKKRS